MEPIFKLSKTTLQEKSRRFNFTCIDCTSQIIALGTDIGSCHLYSTKTLRAFGQIIYLPNLKPKQHTNQSQQNINIKAQSIITSCKFSLIQHEKNFICLLIGTASGHIHLYNVDILNCKSSKVQTIQIDNQRIECLLWCRLQKLNMDLLYYLNPGEHDAMHSFKIIVSVNKGKIYLLHLNTSESAVKIINVQLIYECNEDEIIQTSFKHHFVLVSCITRCFILDFSEVFNLSMLSDKRKAMESNNNARLSLPFVNGNDKYFICIYMVGSKPRNGYYGACFDCQSIDGCDQILSARKSGRVWVGETQSGSVRNTLRFKLPKRPNVFAPKNGYYTADIDGAEDTIWKREVEEWEQEAAEDPYDGVMMNGLNYEFANVSETVCQNLGILIPFGNWTLSYVHPKQSLQYRDDYKLDFSKCNKKRVRLGYHERLNHFGLRILDHNIPKLLQWYPNMGRVIDIAVLESQCCLYIIYEAVYDGVYLGRIELCSPNESVSALIGDDKLNTAIDYLCAYKVRDEEILRKIKNAMVEIKISDHHENKFALHVEEDEESKDNIHNTSKFIRYRRASIDYEAAQKKESQKMKWAPAKFDDVVSTAEMSKQRMNEEEEEEEEEDDNEEEEEPPHDGSVQSMDYQQQQRVACARRKSAIHEQIFVEAAEEEVVKKKKKKKKKKRKKKKRKKKAEFAVIDPAPLKKHTKHKKKKKKREEEEEEEKEEEEITHTAAPGSGRILALDPLIKPHQIIYPLISKRENEDVTISIGKVHKLLRDTARCDMMLRRRMRNELEDGGNELDDGDELLLRRGLSNINYTNCPRLMGEMSVLLGEYESISALNMKHILFYKWSNKMGEKLSTVLTRMLCVFISVKIDIGKESQNTIQILRKFLLILDFKWVLKLCNTHKLHDTLRQLSALQFEQNEASFNRNALEMAYIQQKYAQLMVLIDKYASPFLLFEYLPLLCEKGLSHLCYTMCVGYFPHCAPWFVRKYMYRYALDHSNQKDPNTWNNTFKSYTKYLKLLFNVHPRTRGCGLLVLDLITLCLSLNAPANHVLFCKTQKKTRIAIDGYEMPSRYDSNRMPLIHSENAYSDGVTQYILSMMSDRSYYIEWSYLEIVFKQYGFWRGLYRVYLRFADVESLILLCVYLDYAQPIFNLLCEQSKPQYWKNLLLALACVNQKQNCTKHRLNYEIAIQYMMRNIGPQKTLQCIKDPHVVNILNAKIDNMIFKQIVKQKEIHAKRQHLLTKLQHSLTQYLVEQYNCKDIENAAADNHDSFQQLGDALSQIKHSSDEWTVMSSVNVRPPTQRAAAPLEKSLTDLFTQLM